MRDGWLLSDDVEKLLDLELLIRLGFVDDFDLVIGHTMTWLLLMLMTRRARLLAMLVYAMSENAARLADIRRAAVLIAALDLVHDHRPMLDPFHVVLEREIPIDLARRLEGHVELDLRVVSRDELGKAFGELAQRHGGGSRFLRESRAV